MCDFKYLETVGRCSHCNGTVMCDDNGEGRLVLMCQFCGMLYEVINGVLTPIVGEIK